MAASFYTAPESSPINMLPLAFSAAFGFYIGIKDGRVPVWGRFNLLGALCGILVTWSTWKSYYEPWGHIPETEAVVTSFFGIWLIFISGVLLGKVVQFKAEQERWGTQSGITFGNERGGTTDQWSPRTAAILGLIGVLGAALLQVIGQVISALLGNGT